MPEETPVESAPVPETDQGSLTPSANSDYSLATRDKLNAWLDDDADDDVSIDEVAEAEGEAGDEDAEVEEIEAEAEVEEVEEAADEFDDESDLETEDDDEDFEAEETEEETEESGPEEEDAEDVEAEEPDEDQPRNFAVVDEEGNPADLPGDFKLRYRADGADREYTLDEVVERAQLGENYNRRSQELAQSQREFEQNKQQWTEQSQAQVNNAWNEFMKTARRFAEDPDFREQFLDEWERISSDPQELQRTIKANQAEQLERELEQYRRREAEEFSRRVWGTVDQIIEEAAQDYPYANSDKVRSRFQAIYQQRGQEALRESVLKDIMREEHEAVADIVQAEKERALAEVTGSVRRQAVKKVVDQHNKQTAKAVKRDKVAKKVPAAPQAPAAKAKKGPKSFEDSRKALQDWADN